MLHAATRAMQLLRISTFFAFLFCVAGANASTTPFEYRIPLTRPIGNAAGNGSTDTTPAGPALGVKDASGSVPDKLVFPDTVVSTNSTPLVIQLTSTGSDSVTFNAVPFEVTPPFALAGTTCTTTLQPKDSCAVTLRFSPNSIQAYSGPSYYLLAHSNVPDLKLPLLGNGTGVPVQQVAFSFGSTATFVQKMDGGWYATGQNLFGELGLGDTTLRRAFTPIPSIKGASKVLFSNSFTLAKLSDGTWVGTGNNQYGQMGLGDTTNRTTFTPIPALTGAVQVVVGQVQTFAQFSDGTWKAAGNNASGQLGLGNFNNQSTFVPVPALTGATKVVSGDARTFARLSDGSWVFAGNGSSGGRGSLGCCTNLKTFTAIPEINGAVDLVTSENHTVARMPDGSWKGSAYYGFLLGLNDYNQRVAFITIPGMANVDKVALGYNDTFIHRPDGSWQVAGMNQQGQLGLGDFTDRLTFVTVPALAGAPTVIASQLYTAAIMEDSSLFMAGSNNAGQFGSTDTAYKSSFIRINP